MAKKSTSLTVPNPGRPGRGVHRPGRGGKQPGAGRPDLAYRLRARAAVDRADVLGLLERTITGTEMEPRFVQDVKVPDDKGGTRTVREVVYAPPMNKDKLLAAQRLLEAAQYVPHQADPAPPGGGVRYVALIPVKARTTKEWLRLHAQGEA